MPLINPPLTKEDFINSRWQDVVNSSERKECSAYNRAFWNKAQEAKEAGNVREQSVFEILAFVTGAAIKPESTDEFFAEVFQNLTDEHLNFLTEIASEVSDPELQARIADILWVKKQQQQIQESNPWVKFDGIFKDDPLFDDFVENMAANRRELDAEVAAYEASLEENQSV